MDDLVAMVLAEMPGPSDLVAQSMGGLIALRVALSAPEKVRRLVLVATSGGVPVGELGGADWRREYRQVYPAAAGWITAATEDLSERLPAITAPVLLIWGDRDPISPPAVGVRLLELLPNARLHTVAGAGHDLAVTRAEEVAGVIAEHLGG
jgi:pimeloyl-ACP methyl ester carboxylesterase